VLVWAVSPADEAELEHAIRCGSDNGGYSVYNERGLLIL